MARQSLGDRFWSKVDKTESCWIWTAYKMPNGYGQFGMAGQGMKLAHRVSFELMRGPIPEGLCIDHLCRNRACVNPDHMEPVTIGENVRRGENVTKTHCVNGHPKIPENRVRNGRHSPRRCRLCDRERRQKKHWVPEDHGRESV